MSEEPISPAVRLTAAKFDEHGKPRVLVGNTIAWHLAHGSPAQKAMVHAQAALRNCAAAPCLAFLPSASFHVTLFEGCLDRVRTAQAWPRDLPFDTPMEEVHKFVAQRLQHFDLGCGLPFRLRFDTQVRGVPAAAKFAFTPCDQQEEAKLRDVRERLAQALNLRHEDHVGYGFHVTVAYIFQGFAPDERDAFESTYKRLVQELAVQEITLELGHPEFCVFNDMTYFTPRFRLVNRSHDAESKESVSV